MSLTFFIYRVGYIYVEGGVVGLWGASSDIIDTCRTFVGSEHQTEIFNDVE